VGTGVVSPPGDQGATEVVVAVGRTTVGVVVNCGVPEGTGSVGITDVGRGVVIGGGVEVGTTTVGTVVNRGVIGGMGSVGITNVGRDVVIGGSVEVGTTTVGIVVIGVVDGTGGVGTPDSPGDIGLCMTVRVPFLPGSE
jgi:hypothetical protein